MRQLFHAPKTNKSKGKIGVIDVNLQGLFGGDMGQLHIFLVSRLPRLLTVLYTGVGMSVAGLIIRLSAENLHRVVEEGMKKLGLADKNMVQQIIAIHPLV